MILYYKDEKRTVTSNYRVSFTIRPSLIGQAQPAPSSLLSVHSTATTKWKNAYVHSPPLTSPNNSAKQLCHSLPPPPPPPLLPLLTPALLQSLEIRHYSFSIYQITMGRFLLMQNSRVLLEQATPPGEQLSLKLCTNRQIVKLPSSFSWSESCKRWQSMAHIRFQYFLQYPLQLQFYLIRDKLPQVIGEGTIHPPVLAHHLNEEVKVLLSYDGLVTGWLYCEFTVEGEDNSHSADNQRFLSLQKLNLTFLEEIEEDIKVHISRNSQTVYEKVVTLNQRTKTLFPNIRMPVKLSDIVRIEVTPAVQLIRPIMFLVDSIKRGKSSTIEFWLRNKHKNKTGSLVIDYFMENIFLENERHMRSRNAIVPNSLEYIKTIAAKKITEKEKTESGEGKEEDRALKRRLEEVDKRILKINNGVNEMVREMKKQESMPSLKKTLLNPRQTEEPKDKLSFYFAPK